MEQNFSNFYMEYDDELINEIKNIKFPLPDDLINKIIDEYVDDREHCGFCNDPMEWNDTCVVCNKYICEFCIYGQCDYGLNFYCINCVEDNHNNDNDDYQPDDNNHQEEEHNDARTLP